PGLFDRLHHPDRHTAEPARWIERRRVWIVRPPAAGSGARARADRSDPARLRACAGGPDAATSIDEGLSACRRECVIGLRPYGRVPGPFWKTKITATID